MATQRLVLNDTIRREFESPPVFDAEHRKHFFSLPLWANDIVRSLTPPNNQVMFTLQAGYFRAAGRFFDPKSFRGKDIESVCRRLKIKRDEATEGNYHKGTRFRHQEQILVGFGVLAFGGAVEELCFDECKGLVKRQIKLHLVFGSLVSFIREHHFEIPNYFTLAAMVNKARNGYENQIQQALESLLTPRHIEAVDNLFDQFLPDDRRPIHQNTPYRLTQLRVNPELMKVKIIRENMIDLKYLKALYGQFSDVSKVLDLSTSFIEELALQVLRSRTSQVQKWKNRNLYVFCFIQYQYFHLGDVLAQTFVNAVEQNINLCKKTYKHQRQEQQAATMEQLAPILESYLLEGQSIEKMQHTVFGLFHTQEQKLRLLADSLREKTTADFLGLLPLVKDLYDQYSRQKQDAGYFKQVALGSQKMQAKVGDILRNLSFSAGPVLQTAVDFYQKKEGNLTGEVPTSFLKPNEQKAVIDKGGKVQVSLYKSLLAKHLSKGLKNGSVYVTTSHEFKAIETYLIDESVWEHEKLHLLERANLRHIESWEAVQENLENRLTTCFELTFQRINDGENLWVEKRKDQTLRYKTPKKDTSKQEAPQIFPQDRLITLFEAMQTVNHVCDFTATFAPLKIQYNRELPDERSFFAALVAYGCNLGLKRMAKTTKGISENRLESTVNNYLSVDNLQKANDALITVVDRMKIHKLYKKQRGSTHTSSDGQKFDVTTDSIHANFSFKYFGKEKGITVYPFISDAHQVFHGLAFSASDREAWYVLNGLMHNEVVETDIHSTDTHGSTDIVFALTYLLGIDFQPRIKEFHLLKLHGIAGMKIGQQEDYTINAGATINTQIIGQQWDNILRLVTSIKLKYTVPSQILKRLNSYALKNPLYQALKELGKVVRTIFLLRYMDDETMRQRIHQQLVKGESFNSLAAAIGYGNGGKIIYASKEDLLLMEGCRRLLENVVICWNYLYLSRAVVKATPEERKSMLRLIPDISPVAWEHFNFQGEFDFDESLPRDQLENDLQAILDLEIEEDDLP
jgi:TnpA family transposase